MFYPAHGVGIIDSIEERNINGISKFYYVFHLINNPMNVRVPVERASFNNMRHICTVDEMNHKLNCIYSHKESEQILDCNYKIRKEKFINKILNGTVEDYLNVIKTLTKLKQHHNLNSNEYEILYKAKKIICEEISASMNISNNEADELLNKVINKELENLKLCKEKST